MNDDELCLELKGLLVRELILYGREPGSIADDAPLFGEVAEGGLGLDSLDSLQIAVSIEEAYGVRLPEGDDARRVYRSVASLAAFIASARSSPEAGLPGA